MKEWACAGILFNVTGAAASHAAVGDFAPFAFHVVISLVFAARVIVSWALRPPSRIVGGDFLEKWRAPSAEASAAHKPDVRHTPGISGNVARDLAVLDHDGFELSRLRRLAHLAPLAGRGRIAKQSG